MSRIRSPVRSTGLLFAVAFVAVGACELFEREELPVPTAAEARAFYEEHRGVGEVRVSGNVVEVHAHQPPDQLRRGGTIWARAGPYFHLLSPSTRDLFEAWPGVAALRVVTHDGEGGEEVARAMLMRDAVPTGSNWRRTRSLLAHALREGTERPRRLEQLIQWGEDHTRYEYNPAYVPR
ncbi:MAG: hypothetical protein ACODAE_08290 [Gemmatimonadota bacterium]